jgi:hypothetical protein
MVISSPASSSIYGAWRTAVDPMKEKKSVWTLEEE